MKVWLSEFTVPLTDRDGRAGIKFEDGGQAAILYSPEDEVQQCPVGTVVADEDNGLFVRIQSWQEGAAKGEGHAVFRSLMGRRVRVSIETLDD